MSKRYNFIGEMFGDSVVISKCDEKVGREIAWNLKCGCGNVYQAVTGKLNSNRARQCKECSLKIAATAGIKHGYSPRSGSTPEYKSWEEMRQRCYNKNTAHYHRYGGRGISVCARWDKFEDFLVDMGNKPTHKHSIDRINNDGNYEPGNCRWATQLEQMQNISTNLNIHIHGEKLSLGAAARKYNIHSTTIKDRIFRQGMTPEEAVTK